MIFRCFIASQMKKKVQYQKFTVSIGENKVSIENPVKIITEGFNRVLPLRLKNPVEEGEYDMKYAQMLRLPAARLFSQGEIIAA